MVAPYPSGEHGRGHRRAAQADRSSEMIKGIEVFLQQIAEAIPEQWSAASFEAIFYLQSIVYEAGYTRKSDGMVRGFQPASGGSRAFRELRKRFKDAGKPLWGRACFRSWPDGTFNMKWGYDGCGTASNTPLALPHCYAPPAVNIRSEW